MISELKKLHTTLLAGNHTKAASHIAVILKKYSQDAQDAEVSEAEAARIDRIKAAVSNAGGASLSFDRDDFITCDAGDGRTDRFQGDTTMIENAWRMISPFLPSDHTITSGFRSDDCQKRLIEEIYRDKAPAHYRRSRAYTHAEFPAFLIQGSDTHISIQAAERALRYFRSDSFDRARFASDQSVEGVTWSHVAAFSPTGLQDAIASARAERDAAYELRMERITNARYGDGFLTMSEFRRVGGTAGSPGGSGHRDGNVIDITGSSSAYIVTTMFISGHENEDTQLTQHVRVSDYGNGSINETSHHGGRVRGSGPHYHLKIERGEYNQDALAAALQRYGIATEIEASQEESEGTGEASEDAGRPEEVQSYEWSCETDDNCPSRDCLKDYYELTDNQADQMMGWMTWNERRQMYQTYNPRDTRLVEIKPNPNFCD